VDKSSLLNYRIWPGTVAAAHRVARSAKEEWAAEVEEEEVDLLEEEEADHSVEEVVETHMVVEEGPEVHTVAEEEEEDHMVEEEEEEDHMVEEEVVHMVGEQVVQEFHDRHMAVEIEAQQKSDHDLFTMAEARSAT
jgi:hypothetical protein